MSQSEAREVPGFPEYFVTCDGRIKGPRGNWLKGERVGTNGKGNIRVRTRGKGNLYINMAVLSAWVSPCPFGMKAFNNDGDKSNNNIENLRWDWIVKPKPKRPVANCEFCNDEFTQIRDSHTCCSKSKCRRLQAKKLRTNSGADPYYLGPKRQEMTDWLEDRKACTPCLDCRGLFPAECMDFDHVRGKKRFGVSQIVSRSGSWEDLHIEISKCELICSNCHRIRTRRRFMENRKAKEDKSKWEMQQ